MTSKNLILHVTQRDIDMGMRGHHYQCPIALALRRQCGCTVATVGRNIYTDHQTYECSKEASIFITDFDLGGSPLPCTLTLEPRNQ